MDPIHAGALQFDGERALVADVVEGHDDVFKPDVAVANGPEILVAAVVTEVGVSSKHPHVAVAVTPPGVFHMRVVNPAAKIRG